ncbi:hypothetical protein BK816_01910 [Boudabousia tangfeifanii]|uniref:YgjP-like metallopeptidase domain-containing protein n=1 Tax=Boudabousia tangfeifanii TaxID=1912795 RepID=A0A1D9MJ44_9ACTO|nr:SprT family zinc-dependent metalloprotease [Boudabousia tangfeifanii]AOZ72200.1 hypothetical protein BK816_01910 [Boudabousia tangfeifanii]
MLKESRREIAVGSHLVIAEKKRVKHLRLRLDSRTGQPYLSVPLRVSWRYATSFAQSQRDWIDQAQSRIKTDQRFPPDYAWHENLTVFGRSYQTRYELAGRPKVFWHSGQLVYAGPKTPGADPEQAQRALLRFYRQELATLVDLLLPYYAQQLGVEAKSIRYKRMRSRWGSAQKTTGALNFNLELARRESRFAEYVIVHELSHLVHADHSPAFWQTVTKVLPSARNLAKALGDSPAPLGVLR